MTKDKIKQWLDYHGIKNYTIHKNLTVDVNGSVDLRRKSIEAIPFQFNHVEGSFSIFHNLMTSLKGSPHTVGESFICQDNYLTSLEGAPQVVPMNFFCQGNRLNSLQYAPRLIGGNFDFSNNKVKNFEYCPQEVKGYINANGNCLESFDKLTTVFGKDLQYKNNGGHLPQDFLEGEARKSFEEILAIHLKINLEKNLAGKDKGLSRIKL